MTNPLGPGPLIYGHRGDSSRAPDNSIEAFTLNAEAGGDGVELDVRRSSDGVLILSHDSVHPTIGPLSEASFDRIRSEDPLIVTLEEGLAAIPPSMSVNVEIKNWKSERGFDRKRTIVDQTIATIREVDDPSRMLISSFDPFAMIRTKRIAPSIARGQLVWTNTKLNVGLWWTRLFRHQSINLPAVYVADDPEAVVRKANGFGLAVMVYVVDDQDTMRRLFSAGVDMIVTNDVGGGASVAAEFRRSAGER
jgi:glycerophosphoryl diester phosphodiesterase